MRREPDPTERELQVFAAMLRTNGKEAAFELGIAPVTLRKHVNHLYRKLGVHCWTEAAVALGWLTVPPT